jgi:hypothetical protein
LFDDSLFGKHGARLSLLSIVLSAMAVATGLNALPGGAILTAGQP